MNTCMHCNFVGEESLFITKCVCKECRKKQVKIYEKNNKEKIKSYRRKYYKNNKKNINIKNKEAYQRNKENVLVKQKEYYENNIEKERERSRIKYKKYKKIININAKKYRENNKEKLKQYHKKYKKENKDKISSVRRDRINYRYQNDFKYRTIALIRRRFVQAFRLYTKGGKTKALKEYGIDIKAIVEYLGEPPQDGKIYHIDHKFPVSAFDLNNPEHIKLCWHPDNLQWLEASENLSKNDKYDKEEFEKYLNEHTEEKIL